VSTDKDACPDSSLQPDSPFHPLDPEQVILETDAVVAFYDKFPLSEGQALVVPRVPVASLYELDSDTQAAVGEAVRSTREILDCQLAPADVPIAEAVQQSVANCSLLDNPDGHGELAS